MRWVVQWRPRKKERVKGGTSVRWDGPCWWFLSLAYPLRAGLVGHAFSQHNPCHKGVSEAVDVVDHIHSSIAELMYGAGLSIIGLVSTGIVASAKTGNSSNPHGVEVFKIWNKTEPIHSNTMELMYERHVKNEGQLLTDLKNTSTLGESKAYMWCRFFCCVEFCWHLVGEAWQP